MAARPRTADHPPLTDPAHVPDVFASGFDVHDWEDWLRLICWADVVDVGDSGRPERRKAASIVIPRSSVYSLIEALRYSVGRFSPQGRQS